MYTPSASDCQVFYYTSTAKMLLSVTYSSGTTEIVSFDVSGTNMNMMTVLPRLRFVSTGYKQTGLGRMLYQSSDIWIFFPTINTNVATPYTSMFTTRINDVAGMNWESALGCTGVHQ